MAHLEAVTITGGRVLVEEADVEEFQTSLRGTLLRPGDDGYDEARKIYNAMIDKRPALIARCAGAADVVRCVNFARERQMLVSVRAGGHNVAGKAVCDGGLMIDLSPMKRVRVDPAARTARAEAGLTWGELNDDLQPFGLAATGAFISPTGVAGLTLGGGLGWLVRKHGLALDNLLSADIVTADGQLLTLSPDKHDDLFWGVRGGGGNFGVVTSFEFTVHPVDAVFAGLVVHPVSKAREALQFFREYETTSPEELTNGALLFRFPDDPAFPEGLRGVPVVGLGGVDSGPLEEGEKVLRPLRDYGPPIADLFQPIPYSAAQKMADFLWPRGLYNYWKSGFLTEFSDGAMDIIVDFVARVPSPRTVVVIEHNGPGAMSRVPESETAFGHRRYPYNFLVTSVWEDAAESEANIRWAREFFDALRPWMADAVYVNYLDDEGSERVSQAYGQAKYERLVALKNKYDPANFFRLNQNIQPTV